MFINKIKLRLLIYICLNPPDKFGIVLI